MTVFEQLAFKVNSQYKEWAEIYNLDLPDEDALNAFRDAQSILVDTIIDLFATMGGSTHNDCKAASKYCTIGRYDVLTILAKYEDGYPLSAVMREALAACGMTKEDLQSEIKRRSYS